MYECVRVSVHSSTYPYLTWSRLLPAASTLTVTCYGREIMTVIGGVSQQTDRMFNCPSCLRSSLCISGGYCFKLSSTAVHVFKDGRLSGPSITIDTQCVPESIQELYSYSGNILVQCRSIGERRSPAYQLIVRDEAATYSAGRFFIVMFDENEYRGDFVVGEGLNSVRENDNFIVSVLNTPDNNQILVQEEFERGHLKLTIPNCDAVERLHSGPAHNRKMLQVIVDCTFNGNRTRQRLLVSDLNLRRGSGVASRVSLPSPLTNDRVIFSPDNSYIVYQGLTTVWLVDNTEPSRTPGILSFMGPVAEVRFLTNNFLLISVPGQNRVLVDVSEFYASKFQRGSYSLHNSVAYCSGGMCSPYVLHNNLLLLFTVDQQRPSYLNLMVYNLSSPASLPRLFGRVLVTNKLDICFARATETTTGSVTPPTSVAPPISSTAGSVTQPTSAAPPINSTTGSVTLPTSVAPPVTMVIVIVVGLFLLAILTVGIFMCGIKMRWVRKKINLCSKKSWQDMFTHRRVFIPNVAPPPGNESSTATSCISLASSQQETTEVPATVTEMHAVPETVAGHVDMTNEALKPTIRV